VATRSVTGSEVASRQRDVRSLCAMRSRKEGKTLDIALFSKPTHGEQILNGPGGGPWHA
jgi:hypothetical protein